MGRKGQGVINRGEGWVPVRLTVGKVGEGTGVIDIEEGRDHSRFTVRRRWTRGD